jgi:hypothetical protein
MGLMDAFRNRFPADQDDEEDEIEVNDEDANGLTTIGRAAYNVLSKQHGKHHSTLWNVTSGRIIGELDLSPKGCFGRTEDPPDGHSDWLPEKMGAMLKLTKTWADVMSLSPPDGKFLDELRDAITHINRNADGNNPPVIRLMFGNIIGKYFGIAVYGCSLLECIIYFLPFSSQQQLPKSASPNRHAR